MDRENRLTQFFLFRLRMLGTNLTRLGLGGEGWMKGEGGSSAARDCGGSGKSTGKGVSCTVIGEGGLIGSGALSLAPSGSS